MGAVGLVFAPLAPLVVVAAAIVFWISSWVYKYQLMYVFISKVESGGVRVSFEFCLIRVLRVVTENLECHNQSIAYLRCSHAAIDDP